MNNHFSRTIPAFVAALLPLMICCTPPASPQQPDSSFPLLQGEYLGQSPPGMTGQLFAPGIISTGMNELNAVFFPGGKEVLFSVQVGEMKWAMVMMKVEAGKWTPPEIAPFSGEFGGVDPFLSPDGQTVYFCSNRPRSGAGEAEPDYDIWSVTRNETGWSEPVNLGPPINSETHEFYPSLTAEGTMYFQSRREGGLGLSDIYRSRLVDGQYQEPELLPEPINSAGFEGDTLIAPDESYLIVSTVRPPGANEASDLYISFPTGDGSWSPLLNMGDRVNGPRGENCQILSPCGRYLFYTSRQLAPRGTPGTYQEILDNFNSPRNGMGDIYWVECRDHRGTEKRGV